MIFAQKNKVTAQTVTLFQLHRLHRQLMLYLWELVAFDC